MGIHQLNGFLARVPEAFATVQLSAFRNRRVVIDGNCIGYKLMHRAVTRLLQQGEAPIPLSRAVIISSWMRMWVDYLNQYLEAGVTPIMVIDGEAPDAKDSTRAEREEKGRKSKETLDEAIRNLDGSKYSRDAYTKAVKGAIFVARDEMRLAFDMISDGGVPAFIAPNEGEKYCTAICREGLAAAVDTRDTDPLAMGCPVMITDVLGHQVKIVRLAEALAGLECNQDFFTDLCIMGGCDFNKNIPGIRLIKAFPLLKKAGSIEGLSVLQDVSMLNYEECRELFAYVPSGLDEEDMSFTRDLGPSTIYAMETFQLRHLVDSCSPAQSGELVF